jgi:hypothetical protein
MRLFPAILLAHMTTLFFLMMCIRTLNLNSAVISHISTLARPPKWHCDNQKLHEQTSEMIMSTATLRRGETDAAAEFSARPIADFLKRVIAAREVKAKHDVANYLASCSNERLMQLGLSAEDIRDVRTGTFQGVRG